MNKDSRTAAAFPDTRWSIVQRARGEDGAAQAALEDLCQLYWRPVYAFVRRRGNPPAAAEDLTQSFFADLLRRGSLRTAAQEKGRMRTFLLTAVSRHMANERERATAQRRGGGAPHLSLDVAGAEAALGAAPAQGVTPEIEFDRQWCLQLLDHVLAAVRAEWEASGRAALFEELKGLISFDPPPSAYDAIAARVGMSESAVKAAAHRLRQRYRETLRRSVADTLASDADVDDEIRQLFAVFQSPG